MPLCLLQHYLPIHSVSMMIFVELPSPQDLLQPAKYRGLNNIYFWLRFGLANAINDYLRLIIRVVCKKCLTSKAYWLNSSKPVFDYKITFWICVFVMWIHKGYFVVKKLVWNICIKVFWYAQIILYLKWKLE